MINVRRSIHPGAADTWESIAVRELPAVSLADGVASLQSWNLHVFSRAPAAPDSPRAGNPILPSDLIFIEPPQPSR